LHSSTPALDVELRGQVAGIERGSPTVGESQARGVLREALGPVLIALAGYLVILFVILRSFGFNPTAQIFIGDAWGGQRFWTPSPYVHHGFGYDGQFFYYLAHDPLLRAADPQAFLDHPAYRYGRILYPALAWLVALGRPEALPWAMLGLNLVAALVGTAATVALLRSLGARPVLALGFAFSPAIVLGLIADLAEPTSLALVAVGLALYLRDRHRAAGLALALATLAREVTALVPLGFAAHAAARRQWRRAAVYALPLALPVAWHLWVWARLGALPFSQSPANFGPPLSGALYRAAALLKLQPPLLDTALPDNPWPELLVVGVSVFLILAGLVVMLRRRDALALQLFIQAAAVLCTSPFVWIGLGSYARVLGLLYLFYGLVVLTNKRPPS
jgi:hypothetical protein